MRAAQGIASAFGMDEATWARHANPWSVWTRVPIGPLFILAVFSGQWIGWWCLVPVSLLIIWTWWNPRAFPPPESTRSWGSRVVMGERVWLNRAAIPIPDHHAIWARVLTYMAGIGIVPLIYGLWVADWRMAVIGAVLSMGAKLWFCDRMVWLFDDMARAHEGYRRWLR